MWTIICLYFQEKSPYLYTGFMITLFQTQKIVSIAICKWCQIVAKGETQPKKDLTEKEMKKNLVSEYANYGVFIVIDLQKLNVSTYCAFSHKW